MVWLWTWFENLNLVLDIQYDKFHSWIFYCRQLHRYITYTASNFSERKQSEKIFILNLQQLLEFVWYSFIVVVALPQRGKHTQCNKCCVKLVLKLSDLSAYNTSTFSNDTCFCKNYCTFCYKPAPKHNQRSFCHWSVWNKIGHKVYEPRRPSFNKIQSDQDMAVWHGQISVIL